MMNHITKFIVWFFPLLILLSLNACNSAEEIHSVPHLMNGKIDLRKWDFQKDGSVKMTGNWKFYWNRFMSLKDLQITNNEYSFATSPGVWNSIKHNGKEVGARGFASYRATILVDKKLPEMALKIQFVYSAYDVYVDGKLIGRVGKAAKRPNQAKEVNRPTIMNFNIDKEEFDIIIHVSNYNFMYGGIPSVITIGYEKDLQALREFNIASEMLIAGIILFMGIYHLVLFFLRRKEKPYLFFAIHCFGIFAYGTITGECLLLQQDFLNSFDTALRITVISSALAFLFIFLFVDSIYKRISRNILLRFQAVSLGLIIVAGIIVPTEWIPKIHIINQLLILVSCLNSWMTIFTAIKEKQKSSRIMIIGFTFLLLTVINDIAFYHSIIDTAYFLSIGLLILCLSEAIVLAVRMTSAFSEVESLSESLDKSNKRLRTLDELKDDFLARTSHELKTPLTGIIGTTEFLLEKSGHLLPKDDRAGLSAIISNGSRLTLLINDILDYSKLQKKEINLFRSAINIAVCTRLVTDLLKPLLKRKNLQLINRLSEDLPLVYADDGRLQQILHNLLDNAIKFTPEGGNIELHAQKRGMLLQVIVQDTGRGIPESELENVFIPFEQIESPTREKKTGTGLGLSITKNLVELHGGTISITSPSGQGTRAEFSLPVFIKEKFEQLTKNESPSPILLKSPPQALYLPEDCLSYLTPSIIENLNDSSNPVILIVDDEPVNLMVLGNQLSLEGYNIITVASGFEALDILEEKEVDLVLLDYMMTDLNGFEVLKKIRELEHLPTSLPVIMITAFFHLDTAAKCFDHGANDYLYKPVKKEDLLMRVKNQLELKEKVELSELLVTYKRIEIELRQLKKIKQVVDVLDEKIIIARPNQTIVFCNQPVNQFIGYQPEDLQGKGLDTFISKPSLSRLWKRKTQLNGYSGLENALLEPRIDIYKRNGEKVRTSISISQVKTDKGLEYVLIIKAANGTNLDTTFKEQAVKLMNQCLWLWETYTGKTKLELAKESNLWTVSFDAQKGSEKAQTMEKYLKLKTFPAKRPKINSVVNTVLYVSNRTEIPSEKREDLKHLLDEFYNMKQAAS